MRIESLKEKPNKIMNAMPLSLNDEIKLTDKVRQVYSSSLRQPFNQHKDGVCYSCCKRIEKERLYEIPYSLIIHDQNNREIKDEALKYLAENDMMIDPKKLNV
jgi:hypothetical protein